MSTQRKQPVVGECLRTRWYAAEGKRLRAEGWRLRTNGDKWNATHALIEKPAAAAKKGDA